MPRRQRAGSRLLLALLVALGIVGMHGTPAMAGAPIALHADRMSMTTHVVAVMAELAPTAVAAELTALPASDHHQRPAEHHLVAPCLANAAPVVLLGSPGSDRTESTISAATLSASVAARTTARDRGRPVAPPDLQKLCICRT